VIELDADGSTVFADRQRRVESTVLRPQVVEESQCLPREVAEFGMRAFGFEFGQDHHREYHLVLCKARERERIGQQYRGVDDEGAGLRTRLRLGFS